MNIGESETYEFEPLDVPEVDVPAPAPTEAPAEPVEEPVPAGIANRESRVSRHRQCPATWEGELCKQPRGADHHELLAQPHTALRLPTLVHESHRGLRWAAGELLHRPGVLASV